MSRTETILRIWLSSPSDLADECDCLEDVVSELNESQSALHGLRFELIRWERDMVPGVGTSPQEVINRQIVDSFDIYVGFMWKRFGTSTGRFESGTEAEFRLALERYTNDPEHIKILFFFKASCPPKLADIDPDQLAKVRAFRKQFSELGVLYKEFRDREELARLLRHHLGAMMHNWQDSREPVSGTATESHAEAVVDSPKAPPASSRATDEEGLIDLIEISAGQFATANTTMQNMSADLTDLGTDMSAMTAEMNKIGARQQGVGLGTIKMMNNRAGEFLERYALKTEPQISRMAEAYTVALDSTLQVVAVCRELDNPEYNNLILTIVGQMLAAKAALDATIEQVRGFRDVIAGLPRITTGLARARRLVVDVIDQLLLELSRLSHLYNQFGDLPGE